MDPCPFVRILAGDLAVKFPVVSRPSTSPFFCKIKLQNFPTQYATVDSVLQESQIRSLAACFTLNMADIDKLIESGENPVLRIAVYAGRRGTTCGVNMRKLLGRVTVEVDLRAVVVKASNVQKGWIDIGKCKRDPSVQLHLSVRAEPDPRFVFQFEREPECNPRVFQVHGNSGQSVFSCRFGFHNTNDRRSQCGLSMSQRTTSGSFLMGSRSRHDQQTGRRRKGWHVTVHDLSGSTVAMASMVTPFVPSHGSDRVSQLNPGAWLILRPGDGAWNPWGRLEAWRECSGSNAVGYCFRLLSDSDVTTMTATGAISSKNGGKFIIDMTTSVGTTPVHTPKSSFCSRSGSFSSSRPSSRAGSGSGLELGCGLFPSQARAGFVMSSTVESASRRSKPKVEVSAKHVTCREDAAAFVALAAAMDLSLDACGSFSKDLRKELRP